MLLPCRQRLFHAPCLSSEQARAGSLGGYIVTVSRTLTDLQPCKSVNPLSMAPRVLFLLVSPQLAVLWSHLTTWHKPE
jgi:hypothetical protein